MASALFRRISRSVKKNGIIGTAAIALNKTRDLAAGLRPSVRTKRRECERRARLFDEELGVDTAGLIHPTELAINSPNRFHAVSYRATDPDDFRDSIRALPIDFQRFTFIDFGSGKGRTLLIATEFQFEQIIGVEFSEELHRIAEENIARFCRNMAFKNIKSVCMDAADYLVPETPLVCYFCNPFGASVMSRVIANLRESYDGQPRDIFIVYYNAKESHLFDEANCFDPIRTDGWARIWRLVPKLNAVVAQ